MLQYHHKAIRDAAPTSKVYYVVTSGEAEELTELMHGQNGVNIVSCDFNRNYNLMGYVAHMGMLQVMRYISAINNNANVCKIDSDCYFVSADWLCGIGDKYTMVGTACLVNYYCKRNLLLCK